MNEANAADNRPMSIGTFASDERGLVVSWLVRVLLGLAILGVVLFDAGSIVVNFFSLDGTADEVAVAVVTDLAVGVDPVPNLQCNRRSSDALCRKAYDTARARGVRITSAHFDQQGVFHVELKRTADTLIVGRIGAIEDWATATASAQADTN